MWHMDGFHKFDGWGFVHGIVDGHSKAIVGMQVSDNNRLTVVKLLHSSCIIWGTTACLRTDRGGENVLATDYMLNVRGVNRFSFFAGSSMRNQRIERQWRDTNQRGVRPLLNTFKDMENAGVIQSDSELDLFILHQVATNLFQRTLETYVDSWNNHPVRTEGKKTPNQLYISGLVLLKQLQEEGQFLRPRVELLQDDVLHLPDNFNDMEYLESIVGQFRQAREVPKFTNPLNAEEFVELHQIVNPQSVKLDNLSEKFILAKRFAIFVLSNRNEIAL
ncbi:uncharacterized protein LOC123474605 [Daphnia magna]|uniref:Integrase catalytic domain-containing protein n=2 Tax=Daphnia magna TaxID=35525 RepID=A0ABQ9ZCN3_9CRUS|nr:uncharacterized protein LOC123474605 [Daphnia magna]XP_045032799.1 uncharacterized protein LOC123474605 [Daphnia magna]KAK4010300.1 hypothetical protein OUZ56_019445 [Daphnia magna]